MWLDTVKTKLSSGSRFHSKMFLTLMPFFTGPVIYPCGYYYYVRDLFRVNIIYSRERERCDHSKCSLTIFVRFVDSRIYCLYGFFIFVKITFKQGLSRYP